MFNHHRGFWGYAGVSLEDGQPLMIQGTGVGGPSLVSVVTDLVELGVKQFVRVGTATGSPQTRIGDLVVSSKSTSTDGVSQALGAEPETAAAPFLLETAEELLLDIAKVGLTSSSDLQPHLDTENEWEGVLARDLSTSGLYSVAAHLEVEALSLLVISNVGGSTIDDDDLEAAVTRAGVTAEAILAAS